MVCALALAMVYMFASAGFFFLPEHLRREEDYYLFNNKRYSQSISETFMDFVHVMLVVGEGPLTEVDAQNRQGDVQSRFLFDIIFFIVFVVLLLNMIFGIIVDKFGLLRDQESERSRMKKQQCFICGVQKQQEDAEGLLRGQHSAFDHHVKNKHYMWSYFDLFVYLLTKNQTEYTGADTFLRTQLDDVKLDWLPLRVAGRTEARPITDDAGVGQNESSTKQTPQISRMQSRMALRPVNLAPDMERIKEDLAKCMEKQDDTAEAVDKVTANVERLLLAHLDGIEQKMNQLISERNSEPFIQVPAQPPTTASPTQRFRNAARLVATVSGVTRPPPHPEGPPDTPPPHQVQERLQSVTPSGD